MWWGTKTWVIDLINLINSIIYKMSTLPFLELILKKIPKDKKSKFGSSTLTDFLQ